MPSTSFLAAALLCPACNVRSSAVNSETGEEVAIKKVANAFDNKIDARRTLREIKLLRHMDHENVRKREWGREGERTRGRGKG